MTPVALPLLLVLALAAAAMGGPWLLRRAAPALVRVPRLAAGLLLLALLLWFLALAALGPFLAWATTGPALLPADAGEVCQRCLQAASPFTGGPGPVETVIPTAVPIALSALGVIAMLVAAARRARRHHSETRRTCHELAPDARRTRLDGYPVTVVPTSHPAAFALPRRCHGIVVSAGLLDLLDRQERAAVLAHEDAHLRQRHHLLTTLLVALTHPLRTIPLAAAIADAVPHYLEIAADNAARHRVSTPALAGALLKLGDPAQPQSQTFSSTGALHAAGPNRIRQLVSAPTTHTGLPATMTLSLLLGLLTAIATLAHVSSAVAIATGCL